MNEIGQVEIPAFVSPGSVVEIGSHTFGETEIIAFAKRYDRQPFHLDRELARSSIFGNLCASGWHTISVWMRLQREHIAKTSKALRAENLPWPEFGPSPGMQDLKWENPVFAGETITYTNSIRDLRRSRSRPEWWLMSNHSTAVDTGGNRVMEFESSVFLKIHPSIAT